MNRPTQRDDGHAPYVEQLADAGDWAGLVRYWIAHQHKTAVDKAIELLRGRARARGETEWAKIADFWENFRDNYSELEILEAPIESPDILTDSEQVTFGLAAFFVNALWCESASRAAIEEQDQYFEMGVKSATMGAEAAFSINDRPLALFFLRLLARGSCEQRKLDVAAKAFAKALLISRELARQRPEIHRAELAKVLSNAAVVHLDLGNVVVARTICDEATEVLGDLMRSAPGVYGPFLAETLAHSGAIHRAMGQAEKARHDTSKAIEMYRTLTKMDPEVHRDRLAMALNNLAAACLDLSEFPAARGAFGEALTLLRKFPDNHPVYGPIIAGVLHGLGQVEALFGGEATRSGRARCQEALKLYRYFAPKRPETFLPMLAATLCSLAWFEFGAENWKSAKASCEEALKIYISLGAQSTDYLPETAKSLIGLAAIHCRLDNYEAAQRVVQKAVAIGRELVIHDPITYKRILASALFNLGAIQRDLKELARARASFEESATIFDQCAAEHGQAFVAERGGAHVQIAMLVRHESSELGWPDYETALQHLRQGCRCLDLLRSKFREADDRRRLLRSALPIFELHVINCVDNWDASVLEGAPDPAIFQEAVWAAESSRARILMDRLSGSEFVPANAPSNLVESFQSLRSQLEMARLRSDRMQIDFRGDEPWHPTATGLRIPTTFAATAAVTTQTAREPAGEHVDKLRHQVAHLERDAAAKLAELRRYDPDYDPEGSVPVLSFAQIQRLVPTDVPTAFVQFVLTADEAIALVTTQFEVFPIRLKELTDQRASDLAERWFDAYYNVSFRRATTTLKQLRSARLDPTRASVLQADVQRNLRAWSDKWGEAIPGLLRRISELLVLPLLNEFQTRKLQIQRLVIAPNRALHVFPLHACPLDDDRFLGDRFEITYTPSLSMLGRCAQRSRGSKGNNLLVGNPTGELRFSDAEVAALRQRYPGCVELCRGRATKEALLQASASSWLLHFAGHATFNFHDQPTSGLFLAPSHDGNRDELLTLREVFALNLRRNLLTVLNGCESGMSRPDPADDYVALPTAFLYAGAVCVVSSLWAVHDVSSALLMDRFHATLQAGESVAAALREAARWLRDGIRDGSHLLEEVLPAFLKGVSDPTLREHCAEAAQFYAERHPDTPPFGSAVHWAAHVATGLAYQPELITAPPQNSLT